MSAPSEEINGRYRILRQVGHGAFGSTYLAEDIQAAKQVVIKIAGAWDESTSMRLEREARALTAIRSPFVANVLDVGYLEDKRTYLVIEWVDGQSLSDVLAEQRLSIPETLQVTSAIAQALSAAHKLNIIHRDIKPQNVMVPVRAGKLVFDEAKLVDFGAFGQLVSRSRMGKATTMQGEIFGTPYYMSPEQLGGEAQSTAADLYGLGVLLYEMLYGDPPFKAEGADNPIRFVVKAIQEKVVPPDKPHTPARLRSMLLSLLEKTPDKRPRSAEVVLEEIRIILDQLKDRSMDGSPGAAAHPVSIDRPSASPSRVPSLPGSTGALPDLETSVMPSASARHWRSLLLVALVIGLSLSIVTLMASVSQPPLPTIVMIVAGVFLIAVGLGAWFYLPGFLKKRKSEIERDAGRMLLGTRDRDVLNATLALEVEALLLKCRRIDQKILGMTFAQMIGEFETARESNNRQAALMNAAQLLERLMTRLSPWYVRHEKLIAFLISIIGVVSGILTTAKALTK